MEDPRLHSKSPSVNPLAEAASYDLSPLSDKPLTVGTAGSCSCPSVACPSLEVLVVHCRE